jgi:hypothetical protein
MSVVGRLRLRRTTGWHVLLMVESKSCFFTGDFKAHSEIFAESSWGRSYANTIALLGLLFVITSQKRMAVSSDGLTCR